MNEVMKVKIVNRSAYPAPSYATVNSAGVDLRAAIEQPLTLAPLERAMVPTGLYMALPEGTEAQVRPRSGLAAKHGISVLNSPGTIDADYRGEIKVPVVNLGSDTFIVESGERIAQLMIMPVLTPTFEEADELDETARGEGGFGSTGTGKL